jgi:hypothetical protein
MFMTARGVCLQYDRCQSGSMGQEDRGASDIVYNVTSYGVVDLLTYAKGCRVRTVRKFSDKTAASGRTVN